jgi:DNA-binding XRE family transcriptional regulator
MAKFTENKLAYYRLKAALTQKALSGWSGVPIRTIQDQEAGIFRLPALDTARKLVRALGVTIDDVWPE